ncbi:MAG TPA: 2-oxo-4-hydroxy-4-carboxy-5-ureidoimidazoline decarboxylase [Vicinamibacterales bacterium]|nr:2-oxo-4-hydroxy-4-carboxy-5-ureidoimidazoline decarboxylase [Vicinamibacterales bacterium]
MTLEELNASDREAFVAVVGWLFEDSPWVAERAWADRPFASPEALLAAMTAAVAGADRARQLALLRAHPDLGARARMSEASEGEQAGAGLDRLTPVEYEQLQRLNTEYRERFGFPFLFAVRGSTTHDVLAALSTRLGASAEQEFEEALRQVYQIAAFRMRDALI